MIDNQSTKHYYSAMKKPWIVIAVVLSLVIVLGIAGFVLLRPAVEGSAQFTLEEVAQKDGKNGNKCYVAVDSKVYDLSGFNDWFGGVHKQSSGKALCGMEGSKVITQSPHGKGKLRIIPIVGTLK